MPTEASEMFKAIYATVEDAYPLLSIQTEGLALRPKV